MALVNPSTAALVAIAWLLVRPPLASSSTLPRPSTLEHGLFDRATGGVDRRAAGEKRLQHYEWIDEGPARIVRVPIERAIDAVVADPSLIEALETSSTGSAVPQ